MDKYEYKIRAEEIKTLISQKKYAEAAKVADSIDWSRVKSVMMLCTVSDLYKINRRFDDAKLLLEMANERHPSGRMIIYSLCDLSIRMGEVVQAIAYYKEFVQIAPNDSGRYVLQYKLYEAQDVGLEERIAVLEELKKRDYREKWGYELAYLYHRVGLATKCVEECDDLILWFGEGKYVMKAMELKTLHQPLSPSQQQKFDVYMMRKQGLNVPESMLELPKGFAEQQAYPNEVEEEARRKEEQEDIHIKPMDVGKYNTINLQKELAESMKEVMPPGQSVPEPVSFESRREQLYQEPEHTYETMDTGDMMPQEAPGLTEEEEQAEQDESGPQYDSYLSQEYNGQISLVVPETHQIEKQITGQMNIDDIMQEWERMKRDNEEKRRQDLKQRVMEQTGSLFRDFEETSRKGMLEQLQKEERIPVERRERASSEENAAQTKIWAAGAVENALKAAASERKEAGPDESAAAAQAVSPPAAAVTPEAAHSEQPVQKAEMSEEALPSNAPEAADPPRQEPSVQTPEALEVSGPEQPAQMAGMPEEPERMPAAPKQPEAARRTEQSPERPEEQESPERPGQMEKSPVLQETSAPERAASSRGLSENEPERRRSPKRGKAEEEPEDREREREARPEQVRSMSREEKRLFAPFVPTKGAMKKLVYALDRLSLAAYTGNLILTGDPGADVMDLAKSIIRDVKAKDPNFSGKLARITGSSLNSTKKNAAELVEKLAGGALLIDEAADMTPESVKELLDALNQEKWGILVILMDTRRNIRKLLEENPDMEPCFNARFDLEALDNGTLAAYGCQYARTREYAIDELGRLALHTRIEDMQTSDHIVTVKDVREIVDEAIYHANRKTPKHFMDVLFARRYDDDDMIILHEGDFI